MDTLTDMYHIHLHIYICVYAFMEARTNLSCNYLGDVIYWPRAGQSGLFLLSLQIASAYHHAQGTGLNK